MNVLREDWWTVYGNNSRNLRFPETFPYQISIKIQETSCSQQSICELGPETFTYRISIKIELKFYDYTNQIKWLID